MSCNNRPKVVSPVTLPNVDSLKSYVSKAPKTNDPLDQYFAAEYYLEQRTPSDTTKAIDLLTKAASQNEPFSANELGNIFSEDSTNCHYNVEKAVEYYKLGVKNGSDRAMINLANLYMDGRGVNTDYEEAFQLRSDAILGLLALAEAGDAAAQQRLGTYLIDGRGCPKNLTEGFNWVKKSADQDYPNALYSLGVCYQFGYGVEEDKKEAFRFYERAAEKGGYSYAYYQLASMFASGLGVERNSEKAFENYLKAAELGKKEAFFTVALAYQIGDGVKKDFKQAYQWYKKAADGGDTNAMNNIGAMYDNGQGFAKNDREAFKWYLKAAEAGSPFSQRIVGFKYFNGEGVDRDLTKAFEWVSKAAQGGDNTAATALSNMYRNGLGTPVDLQAADYWERQSYI